MTAVIKKLIFTAERRDETKVVVSSDKHEGEKKCHGE
jgi:hypothetical protein